jgi:hypothetical protein
MDPLKWLRSTAAFVVVLLCLAYAMRWSYELLRPVLPLIVVGGSLLLLGKLAVAWRRSRW